jgi:hypothetical protein
MPLALTLNPSPVGRGTLKSGSLLPQGEGLGMRAMQEDSHLLGLVCTRDVIKTHIPNLRTKLPD